MEKKLTTIANVLIIVVALGIGVQLLRGRMISAGGGDGNKVHPTILEGKKFPIKENWNPSKKTVVLALQVGCHYCSASAPFYARLSKFADERGINIIAALPNSQAESRTYLSGLNLNFREVQQIDFQNISVSGTPTVFVVNDKGLVEKVWEGQLRQGDEERVLALLS
jgi:hypothetical protein